jgi:hypothetical protein
VTGPRRCGGIDHRKPRSLIDKDSRHGEKKRIGTIPHPNHSPQRFDPGYAYFTKIVEDIGFFFAPDAEWNRGFIQYALRDDGLRRNLFGFAVNNLYTHNNTPSLFPNTRSTD